MMGQYTKLATRRREGYPVGVPAPLYIHCTCGRDVDVPGDNGPVQCRCGITFEFSGPEGWGSHGWIKNDA